MKISYDLFKARSLGLPRETLSLKSCEEIAKGSSSEGCNWVTQVSVICVDPQVRGHHPRGAPQWLHLGGNQVKQQELQDSFGG